MKKLKLFLDNFFIYGLGGMISKVIPFVMIPIITRIMPSTEYYGLSDLSNTVVSLSSAVAIMGMYDAMYRMFFEKDEEHFKKKVCSTALGFTIISSILVFILMLLLKRQISMCFFGEYEYEYLIYLAAFAVLVSGTNSIISAPTRMQNKRGLYILMNTVGPLISYSISIPILLRGYYTIALPLAAVVSGLSIETVFWISNRKWFRFEEFDWELLKQLLRIAIPLLPNFLIYWVFNSCDRVMITNMIGIGEAGVYSVGAKLGHASQLIYMAFAGGWQFFAFSTMKDREQVRNNSLVFEYLGVITYLLTAVVCVCSFPLFKVLLPSMYLSGYIVAPYLFMAPLLQMLFQVAANQFLVIKKTWPNLFILSAGAITNVILNMYLIPRCGIEGAAIATLVGYAVSDVICVLVLVRLRLMVLNLRFCVITICMVSYFALWRFVFLSRIFIGICGVIIFLLIGICLYRDSIRRLANALKKEVLKKVNDN